MKKNKREEIVESVSILIRTKDNRTKEIPLEPWQLEGFALILGLQVNLPDLDDYTMSGREAYEERMALYKEALRELYRNSRD